LLATAAIPPLAWFAYLGARLPAPSMLGVTLWFSSVPGQGIIARLLHPRQYALAASTETVARIFDAISVIGIAMAVVIAIMFLMRARKPLPIAAFLYALLALALSSPLVWSDPFSYPRVLTPLLMLLPLIAAANQTPLRKWWWTALPVLLVDLRIVLQIGPQILGIVKGIV